MKDIGVMLWDEMANEDAKSFDDDSLGGCDSDPYRTNITVMDLTERLVEMSCAEGNDMAYCSSSHMAYCSSSQNFHLTTSLNSNNEISPRPPSTSPNKFHDPTYPISPSQDLELETDVTQRQPSYFLPENTLIPGYFNHDEHAPEHSYTTCKQHFVFKTSASSCSSNLTSNVLTDTPQVQSLGSTAHSSKGIAAKQMTAYVENTLDSNTNSCVHQTYGKAEAQSFTSGVLSLPCISRHKNIANTTLQPRSVGYSFPQDLISKSASGTNCVDHLIQSVSSQDALSESPLNVTLFSEGDCLSDMEVAIILTDLSNDTTKVFPPDNLCPSNVCSENLVNTLPLNSLPSGSNNNFTHLNECTLISTPTSETGTHNLRIHLDQARNQGISKTSHLCEDVPRKNSDIMSLPTDQPCHAPTTEASPLEISNLPKLSALIKDYEQNHDHDLICPASEYWSRDKYFSTGHMSSSDEGLKEFESVKHLSDLVMNFEQNQDDLRQPTFKYCLGNNHLTRGNLSSSDGNLKRGQSAMHPEYVEATDLCYHMQSASCSESSTSSNISTRKESMDPSTCGIFDHIDFGQTSSDLNENQSQSLNSDLVPSPSSSSAASSSPWLKNHSVVRSLTDSLLSPEYVPATLWFDATFNNDSSLHQESFTKSKSEMTTPVFGRQDSSAADIDEGPQGRDGDRMLNRSFTSSIKIHLVEKLKRASVAGRNGNKSERLKRERKRKSSSFSTLDIPSPVAKSPSISGRSDSNSSEDKGGGGVTQILEKREKNRIAAQRCRRLQLDKMESLGKQINSLEGKQKRIKNEISRLEIQKEELESMLKFHSPLCKLKEPQMDEGGKDKNV